MKPSGVSPTEEIKTPAIPEEVNAKGKDTTNGSKARTAGPSTSKRLQDTRALERKKSAVLPTPTLESQTSQQGIAVKENSDMSHLIQVLVQQQQQLMR